MARLACISFVWLLSLFFSCKKRPVTPQPKALLFTRTSGYRHESIEAGITMFSTNAAGWGISITDTALSNAFTTQHLAQYKLIILLNTTGTLFTAAEQQALQQFVQKGGAILAIHGAADAEYAWPWYNNMIGGWFASHPAVQQARCLITMPRHISVNGLPTPWLHTDEWYNFKDLQPDNHVVITVDEGSYTGGTHGAHHPISWYRTFDGGKIFYTGMGHTTECYTDPLFHQHMRSAISWLLAK